MSHATLAPTSNQTSLLVVVEVEVVVSVGVVLGAAVIVAAETVKMIRRR